MAETWEYHFDVTTREWESGEGETAFSELYGVHTVTGVRETYETRAFRSTIEDEFTATEQAVSYARAWLDSMQYTLEERLGPHGLEWQREQREPRLGDAPF